MIISEKSDEQLYLKSFLCHLPSTKRGLVYRLGLRLRTICEKQEDYMKQKHELEHKLGIRRLNGRLIEGQLQKVEHRKDATHIDVF